MSNYTREQFDEKFHKIYNSLTLNCKPCDFPKAFLLGGQSGSGKSTIHQVITDECPNIVIIDGDRFREKHPHFLEIQEQYGKEAANYTQPFVNEMITSLIERLSSEKFNLIIEGTCRNVNIPMNTCNGLKQKGYYVELAVMCTDKEVAWQSTINRYNAMKDAGLIPRAVPRDKYVETVKALPQNISQLYKLKIFDDIRLYDRDRNCLYKYSEQPATDPKQIFKYKLNEFSKDVQLSTIEKANTIVTTKTTVRKSFSQSLEDFAKRVHSENATKKSSSITPPKPKSPKH
ncbi:MAG: zeta toxin family protein [Oscillospiraceae bacterium]|nr:zeta toxin family protein [Oscillospiraceae bacterium]